MRQKLKFVLTVLAVVGVFFLIDTLAHHPLTAVWPRVLGAVGLIAVCLTACADRESVDTFLVVVAALLTLFAAATATALRDHRELWTLFSAFVGGAAVLVLLTQKKRQAH